MFKLFIPLVVFLLFVLNVDSFAQRKYSYSKKSSSVTKYTQRLASFKQPNLKPKYPNFNNKYKPGYNSSYNLGKKLNFPNFRVINSSLNSRYIYSKTKRNWVIKKYNNTFF